MAKRNTKPEKAPRKPREAPSGDAINRMVELARAGWTLEGIAIQLEQDGLGNFHKSTIGIRLKQLEENGADIGRRKRHDPRSKAARAAGADTMAAAADSPTPVLPVAASQPPPGAAGRSSLPPAPSAPRTIADELDRVRRRLDEIGDMIAAAKKNGNTTNYGQLVKMEASLVRDLQAMQPPEPADPEKDPSHVESRRKLIASIERLLDRARKARAA